MSSIIFQEKDAFGYIILNRPEKRNALSLVTLKEFQEIIYDIKKNKNLKAIIIKGKGKDFCAGHDLLELDNKKYSIQHFRRIFTLSASIMQELHYLPQPIIAQVQGNATAAGCQLVASCDLAVADKNARFCTPGVKIGLFCSTPMVPLCRCIGRKKSLEMLFTGKEITAIEAKQFGLINKVVDKSDLEKETKKFAEEITCYSPLVVALGKKAFYNQIDHLESDAYTLSKEIISLNCLYDDADEGIKALLEKRKPTWND